MAGELEVDGIPGGDLLDAVVLGVRLKCVHVKHRICVVHCRSVGKGNLSNLFRIPVRQNDVREQLRLC